MRKPILLTLFSLPFLFSFYWALNLTVSGKVIDAATGNPLPYASVMIKGTTDKGVATDLQGNFTLSVKNAGATLLFTAIGYEEQELKVTGTLSNLTIKLKPSTQVLTEVVVTGMGVSKQKKEIGYSITTVNGTKVAPAPGVVGYSYEADDYRESFSREGYDGITENRFLESRQNPLSTFSIDVDAASYANVRRFLNQGQLPPAGAVRIEEMINYFKYNYPQPTGADPFSINTEVAACPWNTQHKIILVGLQGKNIPVENLPPSNLVFLVDVSGSMMEENKLPLVQKALRLLVDQLRPQDKVSLVAYAGNAGLVLPATSGSKKQEIKNAIDKLEAGGSTAGGEGIELAYSIASKEMVKGGNNRVILTTDGDFNVGMSSDDELITLIEKEREKGIFLSVLGFGTGNYQDAKMQKLADKGNGNHNYIDNFNEARKVLGNEFGGTLFTIAKDVKIQVEFNPELVQAYRLIGYENRLLNKEDFNNDKKDAGELGSGHTVTALYEVIPVGVKSSFIESVDPLKYQQRHEEEVVITSHSTEWMTIKFRYKAPDENKSKLIVHVLNQKPVTLEKASENLRFATAVAEFGMLLRNSEFKQESDWDKAWQLARSAIGEDREGYRAEFVRMILNAKEATAQKK